MAPDVIRVLLVEDENAIVDLVKSFFAEIKDSPFELQIAENLADGLEIMRKGVEVILLDLNLPDSRGLDTLRSILGENPDIPVVVYTGIDDEEVAIQAVREGAQDYLIKSPISTDSPVRSIRYALERKRIERALKDSEEINRKIVRSANNGIVVVQEGLVKRVNPKGAEILGLTEEEILTRRFVEFVHAEDVDHIEDVYSKKSGEEEIPRILSLRIVDGAGELKWVEANATTINWEGKPSTVIFMNDVTRRKEAEEELGRQHQRLEELVVERTRELKCEIEERKGAVEKWRHLFETSADVIYLSTLDGKFIDINTAGEKLFGYERDELLLTGIEGLCNDPDDWTKFQKSFEDGGYVKDWEITLKRKDGSIIEGLVSSTLRKDVGGRVVGNQGIIKDITDRKKLEEITLNSIADGVFTTNREQRVTSFNAAAEKITGIAQVDAINKKYNDVLNIIKTSNERLIVEEAIENEEEVYNERMRIFSGKEKSTPINLSVSVLKDTDGFVLGNVFTIRDLSTIEELRKELTKKYTFEDIISKNRKIGEILHELPFIAKTDTTVLIEGKSGTGKELIARAVHNLSNRKSGPFIAVNCAALPENLLESEMFGYIKGAFTDAKADKQGYFAQAQGGTILLDEIGELPLPLQGKLLRVIEEKEYQPLGGSKPMKADIRIIASTNRNIPEEIEKGNFREDLFYRINIVRIILPELKDRMEDIPLLVDYFIGRMANKMDKNIRGVSEDVMKLFMNYDFPGNIRELENIIERAFIVCERNIISLEHLPGDLLDKMDVTTPEDELMRYSIIGPEKEIIKKTLEKYKGDRSMTAKALHISRSTLWRKMKKYNITLDRH